MKKLLVTDYDNTYELHHKGLNLDNIFYNNKFAIEKFMRNNLVMIATGRHFDAIKKTIDEKNIKFDFLCCNNGAELYDKEYNLLFSNPIDRFSLDIIKNIRLKENIFYRTPYNSEEITSINIYLDDINIYNSIKKQLNFELINCNIEFKYPKIKIIDKNSNKVMAVDFFAEKYNFKYDNIYVIGDDINDIEMIKKYNGYSLLNASNEVKKYSKKNYNFLNELIDEIINKKHLLILGGNSKNNISWLNKFKNEFKENYEVNEIFYEHWNNNGEIDFDKELKKIESIVYNIENYYIISKSIGSVISIIGMSKKIINPKKIIILGYPLNLLKNDDLTINSLLKDISKETEILIIQQENDPLGKYDDVVNEFGNINVINISGNDHSYDNIDAIKTLIEKFLNDVNYV